LFRLISPPLRRICTLAARRRPAGLSRISSAFGFFSAIVKILPELVYAVLDFADAVGDLTFGKGSHLSPQDCAKANCDEDRHTVKHRSLSAVHIGPPNGQALFRQFATFIAGKNGKIFR
jgi:hypothetical protein